MSMCERLAREVIIGSTTSLVQFLRVDTIFDAMRRIRIAVPSEVLLAILEHLFGNFHIVNTCLKSQLTEPFLHSP